MSKFNKVISILLAILFLIILDAVVVLCFFYNRHLIGYICLGICPVFILLFLYSFKFLKKANKKAFDKIAGNMLTKAHGVFKINGKMIGDAVLFLCDNGICLMSDNGTYDGFYEYMYVNLKNISPHNIVMDISDKNFQCEFVSNNIVKMKVVKIILSEKYNNMYHTTDYFAEICSVR